MEPDRRTSKGGFFRLFGFKTKSKKKLLLNKSELLLNSETLNSGKHNVAKSLNRSQGENELHLRGKRNDDHISSSVASGDGYETKPPSVVARLMGLDRLPTSAPPDPSSSPFSDPSSPLNSHSQRFNLNPHINYHYANYVSNERGSRNVADQKLLRMRTYPIEKFETEIFSKKPSKCIPITNHKRLSPIKNPGFLQTYDLAHIVQASSKIIDQCPPSPTKSKTLHSVSSSVSLRRRDVRERMGTVARVSASAPSQRLKKPVVDQYNRGSSMERHHNGSLDTKSTAMPISLERETSGRLNNKGKSASLAVQAMVNNQRKEGLSSSGSRSIASKKEIEEVRNNQRNQGKLTGQQIVQKRNSTSRDSGSLKQKNQKQIRVSNKEKILSKASLSAQQNKKSLSVGGSVSSVNASSKIRNSVSGSEKLITIVEDNRNEMMSSRTKSFSEKKQPGRGDTKVEDTVGKNIATIKDHNREIKYSIMRDDCLSWDESESKSSMDVVSFAFTSPIKKSHTISESSGQLFENGTTYHDDSGYSPKNPSSCYPGSNVGDALSVLLEQKIKELTCRVEPSDCNFDNVGSASSSSYAAAGALSDGLSPKAYGNWQGLEEIEGQGSGKCHYDHGKKCDHRFSRLLSALDHSSSDGRSTLDHSSAGGTYSSSDLNSISITKDLDLSDTASSSSVAYISGNCTSPTISLFESERSGNWEVEYIRKILFSSDLVLDDLVLGQVNMKLNTNFFNHMENLQTPFAENADRCSKLQRKLLFDLIGECLSSRGEQILGGNPIGLSKMGTLFQNKGVLAEDLYREISNMTSIGDLMVDELVDKDMSSGKGKWVDFDTEAFEVSVEIEKAILSSLVDELVADLLSTKSS